MEQTAQQQAEAPRLAVNEVQQRLQAGERLVFVDTRNPQAWGAAEFKLPGAIRIPADAVALHLGELPRDRTIITYCT